MQLLLKLVVKPERKTFLCSFLIYVRVVRCHALDINCLLRAEQSQKVLFSKLLTEPAYAHISVCLSFELALTRGQLKRQINDLFFHSFIITQTFRRYE